MKTDTEIKLDGIKTLMDALGKLEAERFIALIKREPFDYTQWQKDMWSERTIKEISNAAMEYRNEVK
ncbi:MAG: hypothetical protein AB1397_04075 [bacterium]